MPKLFISGNSAKKVQCKSLCIQFENFLKEIEWKTIYKTNFYEIEKLAELREKGIISEKEFEAKKRQILGL